MKSVLGFLTALALAAGAWAADAVATVDASGPYQLIDSASKVMLQDLDKNRDAYRKDMTKLYKLVDDTLLPHFDTQFAGRAVLGTHWTAATPEQRRRFVDAFYKSLLRTYADALVDFTADRMKIYPLKVADGAKSATVRSKVKRSSGAQIDVLYIMRRTPQGWKAWDVSIDGISSVRSFKEDLGAEIDQKGIDAVIKRLESDQGGAAPAPRRAA